MGALLHWKKNRNFLRSTHKEREKTKKSYRVKRVLLSTEQLGASDIGYLNANEWGNKLARAKRPFNVNNEMGPTRLYVTFSPSSSLCASSRHGDCHQTGALCRGNPLIKLTSFVVYTASGKKYFFTVRLFKPRMRHINRAVLTPSR